MDNGLSNKEVVEIYERYGHLLFRRCRLLLRDPILAEDAFHEALIKIMRLGGQFRQVDAKLRWLYRVVDNCCFDLMGQRKRRAEVQQEIEESSPHPSLHIERRDLVLKILSQLRDKERTIAVLTFVDEMSQEEIARETNWSRQTVNKKLKAINQKLDRLKRGLHV